MKSIINATKAAALALGLAAVGSGAHAADQLTVPDASVVKYAVQNDGRVYIRNLNEVDPTWPGCCFNFWIDITTDVGRAQFSAFITARTTHQKIMFYVGDKNSPTAFALVGDW